MKRIGRYILNGLAVLYLLLFLPGCTSTERTDSLANVEPFSAFVGKDVTLLRDVLLVRDDPYTVISYADESTAPEVRKSARMSILIPAGTSAHVTSTRLESSRQSIFQGFFHLQRLLSTVQVTPPDPRWPSTVEATFDHSSNQSSTFGYGVFKGSIRPAPWEALDVQASRPFVLRN